MNIDIPRIVWSETSADQQDALLMRATLDTDDSIRPKVEAILAEVRSHGDSALRTYTEEFDSVTLDSFEVSEQEFLKAENALSQAQIQAIETSIENVRRFHEQQLPVAIDVAIVDGVRCQRVSHPIDSIGLYVPAGSAPLPSTAIMLCVPAAIAGCPQGILCTPSQPDGQADPAVLTAVRRAGATRVFKLGGAQAIAAMAYGTESVPTVEKIFGPGNAWVTAAKIAVSGDPGGAAMDMPAGPSEVLVIADESADAAFVASDLLSQAEHGEDSQAILICTDSNLANAVVSAIGQQLPILERRDIVIASLRHSRIILMDNIAEAILVSNRYAPEHLIIHTRYPRDLLPGVRNAGSVFLGPWSPESVGDYCSGTNHVLPTNGAAKCYSGLGVDQFLRHMTVQELSRNGLEALAPTVIELATLEGLDAHANAIRCRLAPSGANA